MIEGNLLSSITSLKVNVMKMLFAINEKQVRLMCTDNRSLLTGADLFREIGVIVDRQASTDAVGMQEQRIRVVNPFRSYNSLRWMISMEKVADDLIAIVGTGDVQFEKSTRDVTALEKRSLIWRDVHVQRYKDHSMTSLKKLRARLR